MQMLADLYALHPAGTRSPTAPGAARVDTAHPADAKEHCKKSGAHVVQTCGVGRLEYQGLTPTPTLQLRKSG